MNWLRVELYLEGQDSAAVEAALLDLGAISVDFSDAADDAILEPEPGATPLWKSVRMTGLFSADVAEIEITRTIAAAMAPANAPVVKFTTLQERDWVAEFKQGLAPMHFGERLWICPTGTRCPERDAPCVMLDPGLAFGTGSHPTTALCLDWLARSATGEFTLLDFGCGSGVLSLAGITLGARATATDIDPQALAATRANADNNAMLDRISIVTTGQLDANSQFDAIVANILSNTLVELAPRLLGHARSGTRIALSGILADQVRQVSDAYEQSVNFAEPSIRAGWALLHGMVV